MSDETKSLYYLLNTNKVQTIYKLFNRKLTTDKASVFTPNSIQWRIQN